MDETATPCLCRCMHFGSRCLHERSVMHSFVSNGGQKCPPKLQPHSYTDFGCSDLVVERALKDSVSAIWCVYLHLCQQSQVNAVQPIVTLWV